MANTFHHGRSIAEHVVMVTLMLSRKVLRSDRLVRRGVWESVAVDPGLPLAARWRGGRPGCSGSGRPAWRSPG